MLQQSVATTPAADLPQIMGVFAINANRSVAACSATPDRTDPAFAWVNLDGKRQRLRVDTECFGDRTTAVASARALFNAWRL